MGRRTRASGKHARNRGVGLILHLVMSTASRRRWRLIAVLMACVCAGCATVPSWQSRIEEGLKASKEGRAADAQLAFEKAVAEARSFGTDDPRVATALITLAGFYDHVLNRPAQAEPLLVEALRIRTNALGRDHRDAIEALTLVAWAALRKEDYPNAEELYLDLIQRLSDRPPPDGHLLGDVLNHLSLVYRSQLRWAESCDVNSRAIEAEQRAAEPDRGRLARGLYNRGECRLQEKRDLDAMGSFGAALAALDGGVDERLATQTRSQLGTLELEQGNTASAEAHLTACTMAYERNGWPVDGTFAFCAMRIGHLQVEEARFAEAEASIVRSLEVAGQLPGYPMMRVLDSTFDLARAYHGLGRAAEAGALYRRSLKYLEHSFVSAAAREYRLKVYHAYAVFLHEQGRSLEAAEFDRRSAGAAAP